MVCVATLSAEVVNVAVAGTARQGSRPDLHAAIEKFHRSSRGRGAAGRNGRRKCHRISVIRWVLR